MEEENKKVHKDHTDDVYPSDDQGIKPNETSEQISDDMEMGERNEDVYTEEGRENLVEDGEISPAEEGFMRGEEDNGRLGVDALTGESLMDVEDVVEAEIDGTLYRFANEENARVYRKKIETQEE